MERSGIQEAERPIECSLDFAALHLATLACYTSQLSLRQLVPKQFEYWNFQRLSNFLDVVDSDALFRTLHGTDIGPMQSRYLRKIVLR